MPHHARVLPLLITLACAQTGDLPGTINVNDTNASGDNGDSGDSGDGDSGPDSGDSAPATLDPLGPDGLLWEGARVVTYVARIGANCKETIGEVGEQLYGVGYAQLEAGCPACQRVFGIQVDVSKTRCITQGYAESIFRGVEWRDDGTVWVHRITEDGARYISEELAEGSWDGTTLTYTYNANDPLYREIRFEGSVVFE